MAVDRRIAGYFRYAHARQWHPKGMLEGWLPTRYSVSEEVCTAMLRFCWLGATNEVDAALIAQYAARTQIASDPLWQVFAPFWLRDETQHADAYFRMLVILGEVEASRWSEYLLDTESKRRRNRTAFYAHCPAFIGPVYFWAALAIDEWNTAREYVAAARTIFRKMGDIPGAVQARIAADEVRHHEYALGALISIGSEGLANRRMVVRVVGEMAEWAEQNGAPANIDQFLFNQEPVIGSPYFPSFTDAAKCILYHCEKSWSNNAEI